MKKKGGASIEVEQTLSAKEQISKKLAIIANAAIASGLLLLPEASAAQSLTTIKPQEGILISRRDSWNDPDDLDRKSRDKCKEVTRLPENKTSILKKTKGSKDGLIADLKCLPLEENFAYFNEKNNSTRLIFIAKFKNLFGNTWLIFADQSSFYLSFSQPLAGIPFRQMRVDGETFNPRVKNIDQHTNQYTFNRRLIKALRSVESSIELATDPGFRPWKIVREIPKIRGHFATKKSQWKEKSSLLDSLVLPTIAISSRSKQSTEIFKAALPSLVTVETKRGSGSGFFATSKHVFTNSHVVAGFEKVDVVGYDKNTSTAKVVYDDQINDFAILRVDSRNRYKPIPICTKQELVTASPVYVIGSPGASVVEKGYLENSISGGLISSVRYVDEQLFIQTDAAMNPGNSGGPIINDRGAVVGISTFKPADDTIQGINFGAEISFLLSESGLIKNLNKSSINPAYCGLPISVNP